MFVVWEDYRLTTPAILSRSIPTRLKKFLSGRWHKPRQTPSSFINQCLRGLPKSAYSDKFHKRIQSYKLCTLYHKLRRIFLKKCHFHSAILVACFLNIIQYIFHNYWKSLKFVNEHHLRNSPQQESLEITIIEFLTIIDKNNLLRFELCYVLLYT
jgi:hypothetical protein